MISGYKQLVVDFVMHRCGVLFLISAVLALVTAYVSQVGFGLVPCKLCIYERIPYFAVIIPAVVHIIKKDKYSFYTAVVCYSLGIVVSAYHAGLEYGVVKDFLHCTGTATGTSFSDIKSSLLSSDVPVSCSIPSFVFMGLSMSGWNVVYMSTCIVIAFLLRKNRNKQHRQDS